MKITSERSSLTKQITQTATPRPASSATAPLFDGRLAAALLIVLGAAMMRLLPHAPNFTPVGAMAVFAGATLPRKWMSVALVLAAMLVSDLIIGFDTTSPAVYAALALGALVGSKLQNNRTTGSTAAALVSNSVLFFVVTNFAVWFTLQLYPKTLAGLAECFVMALPFFQYTLLGDLFYGALFFGLYAMVEKRTTLAAA